MLKVDDVSIRFAGRDGAATHALRRTKARALAGKKLTTSRDRGTDAHRNRRKGDPTCDFERSQRSLDAGGSSRTSVRSGNGRRWR
ncbi:hypothetical protein F6X38_19230 [Aureimonas leprariae]|uniref:Uncharacterized protein n=1 Tax=Plantimonas leprariae TaxID=2615207 RepID=A0A7V7PLH8_9HYPH|nr:hypothetical protein F6X38_19230 [Aureimonas leprariae]